MKHLLKIAIWLVLSLSGIAFSAPLTTIRVGVLSFGTVAWELEVMRSHELAKKRGVDLVIIPLASGDASTIALQGGSVDVIVSDWLWVSRQRADANLFSFVTYSNAVGSVVKYAAGRSRPYAGNGKRTFKPFIFKSYSTSFPSGHTVSAFAVASVYAAGYDNFWAGAAA